MNQNQNLTGWEPTEPGVERSQQQRAGNVAVMGKENALALVNAAGNAAIDQSHHIIYNYTYYYQQETRDVSIVAADASLTEQLPCPYKGLFHFGPEDAELFFGREAFVAELFEATQNRNFIPVLGASGSGKSSVVLAGLVPRLQQAGHWLFTHFRPGADPFQSLAEALVPLYTSANETLQIAQARLLATYFRENKVTLAEIFSQIQRRHPQHRVLLIADQFEELYTLCPESKLRQSFLDTLLAGFQSYSGKTNVLVATLRADFLGNALSYPKLGEVLRNTDVKIRSMNRKELSKVIVKPAEKLNVTFQDGLVERILDDVEDEAGNLPLLEFALTELWQRRQGKQLTHAAYEEIGGVQGALARHADQSYHKLSSTDQEQIRRIFIQLVRPGEGTEDTRRLATKAELGEAKWSLVQLLAEKRLVVTSSNKDKQETVEVVHEALIRNWGQLRQWMAKDRLFRAWQERLRAELQQWEETKQDEGALLRGVPLMVAEEKLKKRREELSPSEQNFIQQSIELGERLRREEKARRRRGIAGVSVAVLAIITALVGGTAWHLYNQWNQARLSFQEAQEEERAFLLNDFGMKKKALEHLKKVIALDPKQGSNYLSLAIVQRELGEKQAALDDVNKALQLLKSKDVASADTNRDVASADTIQGLIHNDLGNKKDALNDFYLALQADKKFFPAYESLGDVHNDLGNKQGALEDYNQALRLDPNDVNAYYKRGNVRRDLGDKQGALEDYNQKLRLDPKDAQAYYKRALVRRDLGDKQGALEDYNQALRLDPNDVNAYYNRGNVRRDLGDKKGALEDYNQTLCLNPNDVHAYYKRGNVRRDLGAKKGALDDYNHALRLAPKYVHAYYKRGNVRRDLGNKQEASRDLQQAAALARQQGNEKFHQSVQKRIKKLQR